MLEHLASPFQWHTMTFAGFRVNVSFEPIANRSPRKIGARYAKVGLCQGGTGPLEAI